MSTEPERVLGPGSEIAERVLSATGDDGRVVIVEDSDEVNLRFANNTVTSNGRRRQRRITVVSIAEASGGWSAGSASATGATGREAVDDLLRAARADAASSPTSPDGRQLLSPGDAGAASQAADFGDPAASTSIAALTELLADLGGLFSRSEAEGSISAGFAQQEVSTTWLASSSGLRLRHVQPTATLELSARGADGTSTAWAGAGAKWLAEIPLESLDGRIRRGLSWSARRVEIPPGRYETVLPGDAVADMIILLYASLSGREALEGRNVFSGPGGSTRVGERLTPLSFGLCGDPGKRGLECSPFLAVAASGSDTSVFDNGLRVERTSFIDDGILSRLMWHRAAAESAGTAATPPVDNLILEVPGATGSVEDLVGRMQRGILLTSLWYIRPVDPATLLLTGLTRDGVYLVEQGEVVGAVNNFRWNESPLDVLARTIECGAAERALSREWGSWQSRTVTPPLRVAEFNMSSVSPAT